VYNVMQKACPAIQSLSIFLFPSVSLPAGAAVLLDVDFTGMTVDQLVGTGASTSRFRRFDPGATVTDTRPEFYSIYPGRNNSYWLLPCRDA